MLTYTARRLVAGIILFVIVSFITYFLLSFSFENIIATKLGAGATPETVAAISAEMGLDRPVVVQYGEWLWNLLHGDLGRSFFTGEPVVDAIPPRLAVTMSIVLPALAISLVIAVFLGTIAAARGGAIDKAAQGVMLSGYLIPNLLVAILLVVILSINLGWLPATGYVRFQDDPSGWLRSITIPVLALTVAGAANISNQIRGTMIDELRKDYIRTLRTRGLSGPDIVIRHALRNSAGPALTVLGLEFISLFGGALIIEGVFALPGFGVYSFNSALQGDFPVLMGLTVFGVGLTVGVNLVTDLANGWLNPKARVY